MPKRVQHHIASAPLICVLNSGAPVEALLDRKNRRRRDGLHRRLAGSGLPPTAAASSPVKIGRTVRYRKSRCAGLAGHKANSRIVSAHL